MKYDYMVFIGRFQPFHLGHKEVVDRALELGHKVILLVGGWGKPRSPRNPWTFDERRDMIRGCLLYTSPSPRDAHESRMPSSA